MELRLGLVVVVNGERKYNESSEKNKLPSEKKRLIPRLKTVELVEKGNGMVCR